MGNPGSRIVTASIGPIKVRDLRLAAFSVVDREHPITKSMLEHLPRLPDLDLRYLRKYLLAWDGKSGGNTTSKDVESWIKLVDAEINQRTAECADLISSVVAVLQPEDKR